jgi:REP element-mobilizing transposase RayT
MVIASHVIFTAYGFWLPNDPRGSWSTFVGAWELYRFGPATKTEVRHSVAAVEHDRKRRREAKKALKYPPVVFSGLQAHSIAMAFAETVADKGYVLYACSILPEHIHAVIARHERAAEDIAAHLKYAATQRLIAEGSHPFLDLRHPNEPVPTMWTKRSWKVFLDSPDDVARAVQYVEENPPKEGKRPQHWSFVQSSATPTDAPRTRGG